MDNKPTERKVQELHNPSSDIFFAPAGTNFKIFGQIFTTLINIY